jgi:excisionase family DNA binding protein
MKSADRWPGAIPDPLSPPPWTTSKGARHDCTNNFAFSPSELAVSPREACALLRVSLSHLYGLLRNGDLDSYRDGRARRIPLQAIQNHVARRLADGAGALRPPRHRGQRA